MNDMDKGDGLGGNPEPGAQQSVEQAIAQAEQEQREKDEQAAVEQAVTAGTALPDPNSEPGETDPQLQHVEAICPGCKTVYGFDIEPVTQTFKFQCQNCETRSEWKRL
jgi:hypothetical protein